MWKRLVLVSFWPIVGRYTFSQTQPEGCAWHPPQLHMFELASVTTRNAGEAIGAPAPEKFSRKTWVGMLRLGGKELKTRSYGSSV